MLIRSRFCWRGVATVEFHVVALFALLPLLLGTLQTGLLLVANHHVDYATFAAARRGAMSSGDPDAIRSEFTKAILPLFVSSVEPLNRDNVVTRVGGAYARAVVDVGLHARFTTLAPDAASQREVAIDREGRRIIPERFTELSGFRSSGGEPAEGGGRLLPAAACSFRQGVDDRCAAHCRSRSMAPLLLRFRTRANSIRGHQPHAIRLSCSWRVRVTPFPLRPARQC